VCVSFKTFAAPLALVLCAVAGSAEAAETLHPRFFWRAPPGATPEESLVITAGAAYPDGGLAVVGFRGDPYESIERSLYRIDPNGRTIWELDLGLGPAAIGTLVRDSRDGLVFCDDRDKVRRADSVGRLDWTVAGWWPPPVDPRYPTTNGTWDCDELLALADGSVIAATVVYPGDRAVLQLVRIGAGGEIMWSSSIGVPWGNGSVAALLVLPGGDIEIVVDPFPTISDEHPISASSPALLEWRISPDGRQRAANRMQQMRPLFAGWRRFASLYRRGDRLVLVADPCVEECRQSFEEWSLDGKRLLAEGFFPSLGTCDEYGTDTGIEDRRRVLLVPMDIDAEYLASLPETLPPVWYRLPPGLSVSHQYRSFQVPRDVRLPLGKQLFFFGEPDELYVAESPFPKR
jgi:hypothetical protein